MCGRYTAAKDFGELIKLVGVVMARVPFFAPRYNIAATQMAAVIYKERHEPAVKLMRWGLIPSWAKDESVGNALINARSETLESRTAFREAFKSRRCLIPADSFFEWQECDGKRQPFRVMLKSGEGKACGHPVHVQPRCECDDNPLELKSPASVSLIFPSGASSYPERN